MAASLLCCCCCCCCWGFHVSARNGLWQISAVSGTGVELWSGPCLAAMEVKWQSIDWEDGRLKSPGGSVLGQGHAPLLQPIMTDACWKTRRLHTHTHTHTHTLYICTHRESIQGCWEQSQTHISLHYEELLVSNHPRLFPIITISFNNNHINWQDEILRGDM